MSGEGRKGKKVFRGGIKSLWPAREAGKGKPQIARQIAAQRDPSEATDKGRSDKDSSHRRIKGEGRPGGKKAFILVRGKGGRGTRT